MKLFTQIESRFGIKLPDMYRDLAQAQRLDHRRKNFFEMPDCLWLTPKALADFTWDDHVNPVDGLVPFATNGCGDHLCWYLPAKGRQGEPAVMECPHDSYEGRWFAPSLAGAVFRQSLEWLNAHAEESELDQTHEDIDAVLEILSNYAPKTWCRALRRLQKLTPKTSQFGDDVLLTEDELDAIIAKCFGKQYVAQDFIWRKLGLPLVPVAEKRQSVKREEPSGMKPDKQLEKCIKTGSQIIKKIKPCDATFTIARDKAPAQAEIASVAAKLGKPVPLVLQRLMAGGEVMLSWNMDSISDDLPEKYDDFSSGQFYCDPGRLLQVEGDKQKRLKKARGSKAEKEVWARSFAFEYCHGSDSFIALEETASGEGGRVLLLQATGTSIKASHELSPDFATFLGHWADLAFVSLHMEVLKRVTRDFSSPMKSQLPFTKTWRKWLEG